MGGLELRSGLVWVIALAVNGCTIAPVPIGNTVSDLHEIEPAAGPQVERSRAASKLDWPDGLSCEAMLDHISDLHRSGRLGAMSSSSPVALLIDDHALSLIGDVPLPVTSQAQATIYDCLIVIGEAQMAPSQPRQIVSDRKLRSSYPAGTKRVLNPDFVETAASANGSTSSGGIIKTGDPTLDLIGLLADGVLTGLDAVIDSTTETAKSDEPRYLEEQRLVPYGYRLAEIEAFRSAKIPVTLVDQRRGERIDTDLALRESQLFALSDDRHPDDPQIQHDHSARLISTLQLRRWEASPPSLGVGMLIDHLRAAGSISPDEQRLDYMPRKLFGASEASLEPVSLFALDDIEPAAGPKHERLLAVDIPEKRESLIELAPLDDVISVGDEKEAVGFFVSSEHLVVPLDAMPITALVPLTYPDQVKVYGLVEKRDPELGLALVFTPRSGSPLTFSSANLAQSERDSSISGQPILLDGAVGGIWIRHKIEGWRWVDATSIQTFAKAPGLNLVSR